MGELGERSVEISQTESRREKTMNCKIEYGGNLERERYLTGIPKGEEDKDNWTEEIFEVVTAKNVPKLTDTKPHI